MTDGTEVNEERLTNETDNTDTHLWYINQIAKYPLLNAEEEAQLARQIADGCEKSRTRLINSNLRLVVNIARRYLNRGVLLADLINEGNIGLLTAVSKFDVTRGFRFSTYATPWIQQSIDRATMNTNRTIRVPVHVWQDIRRIKKLVVVHLSSNQGYPTVQYLSEQTGLSEKAITERYAYAEAYWSLDHCWDDENHSSDHLPHLADHLEHNAEDEVEKRSTNDVLYEYLHRLPERDKQILIKRYGLDEDEQQTLVSLSEVYEVTRERIRQLEKLSLKTLREEFEKRNIREAIL